MDLTQSLLLIAALIAASAFFSLAEISLAASRRLRLRQMADDGDLRAERVLRVQEQPGHYFTVVQIGLNAVAILGGVVGEGAFSPGFARAVLDLARARSGAALGLCRLFRHRDLAVPGVRRPVPQTPRHEQPGAAGDAHGGADADADHRLHAAGVALHAQHRCAVQAAGHAAAARRQDHLGRHPGHDRSRCPRRRAGGARAAGDRQRVRARHAPGQQRDDLARPHRLVSARRPRGGAARAHRRRAVLGLPGVRWRHRPRAGVRRRQGDVPARAERAALVLRPGPDPEQGAGDPGPAVADRGARTVPAGARRLRDHRQRVQPGGRRDHAQRRDEHGDGRPGRRRRTKSSRSCGATRTRG